LGIVVNVTLLLLLTLAAVAGILLAKPIVAPRVYLLLRR